MTATLHVLPVGNLTSVVEQLRAIADEIESGERGQVLEGALVIAGDELHVYGLGRADGAVAHYMLARAQRKLERIDLL